MHKSIDILYQSALAWKELTEYSYTFTYGRKHKLYTINLTFSMEDYPHLAGFQYLKDTLFLKYNFSQVVNKIINKEITLQQIIKGNQFEQLVKPRLAAIVNLKNILDNDFLLFSYLPHLYPFTTTIRADYIISSGSEPEDFVFIIKMTPIKTITCNYRCCSAFTKDNRDYKANQRKRTILKKERLHIRTNTTIILFDRLSKL